MLQHEADNRVEGGGAGVPHQHGDARQLAERLCVLQPEALLGFVGLFLAKRLDAGLDRLLDARGDGGDGTQQSVAIGAKRRSIRCRQMRQDVVHAGVENQLYHVLLLREPRLQLVNASVARVLDLQHVTVGEAQHVALAVGLAKDTLFEGRPFRYWVERPHHRDAQALGVMG